eukprot:scpid63322/ scgid8342/ Uncharacterized oxidoreductase C663.08c
MFPRSVLITGANRGIGLEMVRQMLASSAAPACLIATHRSSPGSGSVVSLEELKSRHSNLHLVQLDVVSDRSIQSAAEVVTGLLGDTGLNLLINNSGYAQRTTCLGQVTSDSLLAHFHVNAVGPIMVLKALKPLLEKAAVAASSKSEYGIQRAAVVHIASTLGSLTNACVEMRMDEYRASKAALNMLGRQVGFELLQAGIVSLLLHPGWVKTDMGTEDAPLTPSASVASMFERMAELNKEKSGTLIDYTGRVLPW